MKSNTNGTTDGGTTGFAKLVAMEDEILNARFSPSDVAEPMVLAAKLRDKSDPVAGFLHERMREEDRDRLVVLAARRDESDTSVVVSILVEVLNAALLGAGLTSVCSRIGVTPREPDGFPTGCREVPQFCVNRMLLEDSFPGVLRRRRWRQCRMISTVGHTGEPWVAFTSEDRVGLALSGGGIRSATVNLGLLQSLAAKGLLGRFHYLVTVSGGGYAGGFWTRWRKARNGEHREAAGFPSVFPEADGPAVAETDARRGPKEIREPGEIRHLREFSRFLIPRSGLNAEFWAAAVAVLGGLVPSLSAAVAVVCGTIATWALVAGVLLGWGLSPAATGGLLAALVGVVLVVTDRHARGEGEIAPEPLPQRIYTRWYAGTGAVALAAVGVAMWWLLRAEVGAGKGAAVPPVSLWLDSAVFYGPSIALLCALGVLVVVQLFVARLVRGRWPGGIISSSATPIREAALGRVMGRMLAILVVWTAFAGIWHLAGWLVIQGENTPSVGELGGATASLTLLFYLVRDWLKRPKVENRASGLMDRFQSMMGGGSGGGWAARLKPMVPRLLADGIVMLSLLLAAVSLRLLGGEPPLAALGLYWVVSAAVLVLVLCLFDPVALGLHEFYRGRLARCFLGAGRVGLPPGAAMSDTDRVLVERTEDDMWLQEDRGLPLHLICCAANQATNDDHLGTLHRGARSVVLSRFGVALGSHWAADAQLRLSSAMTASAAAFNSLMGERTLVLGRAVSFVLTALNLRLGLWVRNPANTAPHGVRVMFPGTQFIREMFGLVQCRVDDQAGKFIHLSDGGHFENLALYELIRRHCRYIVVVDAGADAQYAFDDLARAVRRVREDFGVEIELDPEPLKPGDAGYSKQHLAVGVVHFDGVVGTDKGTIVYLKPSLTGDETSDILQYRQRKSDFPQESTGDQFFDEAQFESYRRLGEHMGNAALRRLERLLYDPATLPDETLFWRLRLVWDRKPPWLEHEAGARLWDHARGLDAKLGQGATSVHCRRFFGIGETDMDERACAEAVLAIQVCMFLEEAWVVCALDEYSSLPAASSWMSFLHRWAATPAVRDWWPAIKTLFGDGFQAFAEKRLHLPTVSSLSRSGRLPAGEGGQVRVVKFAASRLQEVRPGHTFLEVDRQSFQLLLELPRSGGRARLRLQIGLAQVKEETERCASWALEDLFIPPEFAFGDYTGYLLDALIRYYRDLGYERLTVRLEDVDEGRNRELVEQRLRRDQASRRKQTDLIDFYRSRGFRYDAENWCNGRCIGMYLSLADGRGIPTARSAWAAPTTAVADHLLVLEPCESGGGSLNPVPRYHIPLKTDSGFGTNR